MTTAVVLEPAAPLLDLLEREFGKDAFDGLPEDEHARLLLERVLARPLADFLSRPGKEFRSRLLRASFDIAGGQRDLPAALPLTIEILHAGSLIVDDIEDGATRRRGEPALHLRYGLPNALNAANWLYFWPFVLLSRCGFAPHVELKLHRVMNEALLACHRGQALDLSVSVADLAQREVASVVFSATRWKTGGLMELSARMGAVAANASSDAEAALAVFGAELGLGLQMLDDLAGYLSARHAHKAHEDLANGRLTWPWAWIAETVDEDRYAGLVALLRRVEQRRADPGVLVPLVRECIETHAKQRVARHLQRAFENLKAVVGSSPALGALRNELQRLQHSYE